MESLPALTVATFVCGLREDSRIKQKVSGINYDIKTILLAMLLDRYTTINYSEKTLITPKLLGVKTDENKESEVISFDSVEDYKAAMQEFDSHLKEN